MDIHAKICFFLRHFMKYPPPFLLFKRLLILNCDYAIWRQGKILHASIKLMTLVPDGIWHWKRNWSRRRASQQKYQMTPCHHHHHQNHFHHNISSKMNDNTTYFHKFFLAKNGEKVKSSLTTVYTIWQVSSIIYVRPLYIFYFLCSPETQYGKRVE